MEMKTENNVLFFKKKIISPNVFYLLEHLIQLLYSSFIHKVYNGKLYKTAICTT